MTITIVSFNANTTLLGHDKKKIRLKIKKWIKIKLKRLNLLRDPFYSNGYFARYSAVYQITDPDFVKHRTGHPIPGQNSGGRIYCEFDVHSITNPGSILDVDSDSSGFRIMIRDQSRTEKQNGPLMGRTCKREANPCLLGDWMTGHLIRTEGKTSST